MITAELTKKAAKGERSAQNQLFALLAPRAFMTCQRYLNRNEDIEEITHDAYCDFLDKAGSLRYEMENELHAYFHAIVVYKCIKHSKKTQLYPILDEVETDQIIVNDPVLDKLEHSYIYYLVKQLPDSYRTVFNLAVIEELDHKEISTLLGITESSSRSNLCRAKKILQDILTDNGKHNEKDNSK